MIVKTINEQLSDMQKLKYKMLQKVEQLTDEELEGRIMWDALSKPATTNSPMFDRMMEMRKSWK